MRRRRRRGRGRACVRWTGARRRAGGPRRRRPFLSRVRAGCESGCSRRAEGGRLGSCLEVGSRFVWGVRPSGFHGLSLSGQSSARRSCPHGPLCPCRSALFVRRGVRANVVRLGRGALSARLLSSCRKVQVQAPGLGRAGCRVQLWASKLNQVPISGCDVRCTLLALLYPPKTSESWPLSGPCPTPRTTAQALARPRSPASPQPHLSAPVAAAQQAPTNTHSLAATHQAQTARFQF